jgi:glycosyltransferase involved in cell wall biosynthesis
MPVESKTLVILSPGFPENEADSSCLPAQQSFVKELNRQNPGLKIIILAFEYPFSKMQYQWNGNRVVPFNMWEKSRLKKISGWLVVWRTLQNIHHKENVIGLLSFWCTGPAALGKCFSKVYSLKHFIWILGQDAKKKNRFIRIIRPKANELIAMSDFLAREFKKNHSVIPAHIIPNAIDSSLYPLPPEQKDVDILGVGSLIPLKQFDLFLKVIAKLKNHLPSIKAVICGKGPEEYRLQKMIRDLDLEKQVMLTGEQPHNEVIRWMQRSHILLHTSSYEGFSTVCLEALYAGAQVISFCKPMDEPVSHWHISDRQNIAQTTLRILLDPDTDHSPVLVYPLEKTARDIINLYADSVNNTR